MSDLYDRICECGQPIGLCHADGCMTMPEPEPLSPELRRERRRLERALDRANAASVGLGKRNTRGLDALMALQSFDRQHKVKPNTRKS